MAEEKNPMDFEEPTDGGIVPAEVEEQEEVVDEEELEVEEPTQEEETNDEEVVASLPIDVIEEAVGYGLNAQDIERLGSEENIAAVLAILDRQMESAGTDNSESVYGDDEDPFAEPDDNSGESNSEIAELRKQVEALKRSLNARPDDATSQKLFGLLSDDYSELFGGVGDDLTKTQERNRSKVIQELETLFLN